MQQKRIKPHKFERLPNVISTAAVGEQPYLANFIFEIVWEEIKKMMAVNPEPETYLEAIIREEVRKTLSPAAERDS